jgi:glycosyltransferase involved in cell wall biosynthesis
MLVEIAAAAPPEGPLAAALAQRRIPHVALELRTASDTRVPRDIACERLLAAIESTRPDVVHANSLAMGRLTGAIAERLCVPTVAHLRDILGLSAAAMADLNRNHQLVAVSRATRAFHVAQGLDAKRTDVVYNGVDSERFRPRPASGCLRRELRLPPDAFLIGTIGQIGLRKGQDVLAEAAVHVAARVPRAHYVLVGERHSSKAESIAFERSVVEHFANADLGDRLHRVGYREDVPSLLNKLDLLVHPAHQEPLGRVLLEAAASGLPIIATNVGGTPEILTDSESARLVPPGDARRLAEAIVELAGDAGLRDRLGRAARRRVVEQFPIGAAADRLLALWKATARSATHAESSRPIVIREAAHAGAPE